MTRSIEVVFYREADRWLAQALNVDVATFGDSLDDARAAIEEAPDLYFEDEPDMEIPKASDARIEEVLVQR